MFNCNFDDVDVDEAGTDADDAVTVIWRTKMDRSNAAHDKTLLWKRRNNDLTGLLAKSGILRNMGIECCK